MRTAILLSFLASLALVVDSVKDLENLLKASIDGGGVSVTVEQVNPEKLKVCMVVKNSKCDDDSPPPPPENSCVTNPIRDCSCFTDMVNAEFSFFRDIQPDPKGEKFNARCDADGEGRIWTAVLYREGEDYDYNADWNRNFANYSSGFSGFGLTYDYNRDFFLGLNRLHALTNAVPCRMKMEASDKDYSAIYEVYYDSFLVGGANTQYKLTIGNRNSQSSDGVITTFGESNGQPFSTFDKDNSANCAKRHNGGWWFPPRTDAPYCTKLNAVGPGPNSAASSAGKFSFDVNGQITPAGSIYMFVVPKD